MTNPTTHRQVPAIQRYKIGYHSDEWGVRSSTPGGISDPSGQWVLYKDYIAALVEAQQPAPSGAVALSDYLRDRLVAISEAIADQDDRAAQAMLREILAAPQPSPTAQADPLQPVNAIQGAEMKASGKPAADGTSAITEAMLLLALHAAELRQDNLELQDVHPQGAEWTDEQDRQTFENTLRVVRDLESLKARLKAQGVTG